MPPDSYRRRLPHLRRDGGIYFVTWRLQRLQAPLQPAERTVVLQALRTFDGPRFHLLAAVVMDDHVHAIVQPLRGNLLERIVQGWKSASARALAVGARVGGCWQREYYDRLLRSDRDLLDTLAYVRNNPRRRWPGIREYPWLYTSPTPRLEA